MRQHFWKASDLAATRPTTMRSPFRCLTPRLPNQTQPEPNACGSQATGGAYIDDLPTAVRAGLVEESVIDTALRHTMGLRFRLGLFDPIEDQPCVCPRLLSRVTCHVTVIARVILCSSTLRARCHVQPPLLLCIRSVHS